MSFPLLLVQKMLQSMLLHIQNMPRASTVLLFPSLYEYGQSLIQKRHPIYHPIPYPTLLYHFKYFFSSIVLSPCLHLAFFSYGLFHRKSRIIIQLSRFILFIFSLPCISFIFPIWNEVFSPWTHSPLISSI